MGDGVLSLFKAQPENVKTTEWKYIKPAYEAAKKCLRAVSDVVNPLLTYQLKTPDLVIGIGMGLSPVMITVVGLEDYRIPKAFGRCVYHATKLSSENNLICVDDAIRFSWPQPKAGEKGKIKFESKRIRGIPGHIIHHINK